MSKSQEDRNVGRTKYYNLFCVNYFLSKREKERLISTHVLLNNNS